MNLAKTGLLLAVMTALFIVVGGVLGGAQGAVIALVVAVGMNVWTWWNSAEIALRSQRAQVVTRASAPDLVGMVETLAARAGLPTPQVYVIDTDQPNAFATGRDPHNAAVAVTRGLVETLDRNELAGVIAHELAHIQNRDTLIMTVAASFAGAIGFLAQFAQFGMLFGGGRDEQRSPLGPIAMILAMILAPIAAAIVQMAISRSREYSADARAAEITGDPRALASALSDIERIGSQRMNVFAERAPAMAHLYISNPLRMHGIDSLFRTHPPTEERIRRLMAMAGGSTRTYTTTAPSAGQARRPRTGPWG